MTVRIDDSIRFTLEELDRRVSTLGWDTPPALLVLERHRVVADDMPGEVLATMPFPNWATILCRVGGDPVTAVEMIAHACASTPEDVIQAFRNTVGLILVVEAWMSLGASDVAPENDPDRIETRTIFFVDTDGHIAALERVRDGGVTLLDSGELVTEGCVADALRELAKNTLARV